MEILKLEGSGITCDTLNRRDTTQAERMYAKHYRIGDFIQPERDYPRCGLVRGVLYRVEDSSIGNRLMVRSMENQQTIEFNPMTHRKLSVYEPDHKELSIGDVVRITRNDKGLDIANGDRFKITSVSPHQIVITNGQRTVNVAVSRARFEATVYTNNKDALPNAITRNNLKFAALDLSGKAYCR